MIQPTFLVIGAMKGGTTNLHALLRRHPEIFMSHRKELHFFDADRRYARGMQWYCQQFEAGAAHRVRGEATPDYTRSMLAPHAAERIAKHLPDIQLVYMVRDPLARAQSHWRHMVSQGHMTESFNRAIREHPEILDASMYWRQIGRYREHFPDDRICVGFLEDLQADPDAELRRLLRFLGVDEDAPLGQSETGRAESNAPRPGMLANALTRLIRATPGYQALRFRVPASWRSHGRRLLKQRLIPKPEWDAATRAWAIEQLPGIIQRRTSSRDEGLAMG